MMKSRLGSLAVVAAVLGNLTACGYIKSYFPDKEKDYQFTTEIPPLKLPPDLDKNAALSAPTADSVEASAPASEQAQAAPVEPSAEEEAETPRVIPVELVKFESGETRLRIGAPVSKAWRMVGKALSRKSLEVTERNQEDALYRIQYDPDEQPPEDGSLWDEVVFMFKGVQANEKEYILKLVANNRHAEVAVLDKDRQPITEGPGLKLLTLLQETLAADQSE
ncbi:outer membrane protein assembly factor BamC [Methylobacter sp. YRD-M1]|uniref:outer membrane protein assembly factor BamC n=1 Tax=Methylobacter sp. YRD-M1 TaxID=2911520 RepID=UPI00227CE804|nr:outer membrane protein assembly factor BamC [Methylobacter sp. YRD-M1]WAK01358.1 outer membrane protein assembly factor BamC [Methylobacter sp. YRD-M1]